MQPEFRRSVKSMNEYVIRFSVLKDELETFEFSLEEKFFTFFESDAWEGGKVKAIVEASKRADGITLAVSLKGALLVICDRCLDTFWMDIDTHVRLFVKFGNALEELDENTLLVPREENQLDMSGFFYDYLVLSMPVKKVHPETEDGTSLCNSNMIEKLNEHIVLETKENTDPRWEELKKLLDKN